VGLRRALAARAPREARGRRPRGAQGRARRWRALGAHESRLNPAYLLGGFASVLFGAADLSGGVAAKRESALIVTCFSGLGALLVLFVGLPFAHGSPTCADLVWGAAAGVCSAAGATLIYRSLALGPAVVASPVFSGIGLCVPVLFGVLMGERPSVLAWTGIALVLLSLPLLSWTAEGPGDLSRAHVRRTLLVATLAGLVVGWFLICVARIGAGAGLLPLVLARASGMALLAAWLLARRRSIVPAAAARLPAFGAGVLDSAANVAYWYAVQRAPIAIIATLVSLAPATTVALARVLLGERWTVPQRFGFALAMVAIACISLG
jgi:drug/metabolite transporter (DMT)-like permease